MQLLKRNIGQRWLPSRLAIMATGATLALSAFTGSALAQPELITKDDVITGTMNIEFDTRTRKDTSGDLREGSTALGAKDKYTFNLRVADTTEFTGEVQRSPNLYSKVIGKKKQEASLFFKINLAVMNPKDLKQKKNVGSWVGTVVAMCMRNSVRPVARPVPCRRPRGGSRRSAGARRRGSTTSAARRASRRRRGGRRGA